MRIRSRSGCVTLDSPLAKGVGDCGRFLCAYLDREAVRIEEEAEDYTS